MLGFGIAQGVVHLGAHATAEIHHTSRRRCSGVAACRARAAAANASDRPKQLFVAAAAFAMAMAMALGLDYTREILNVPGRHTVHAVINDANKEIVVLRTGERGLLIYEPDSRRFAFAKWDTVKGFDWPRQPILNVQ